MTEIIPYEEKYAPLFKALNMIWLNQYDLCEEHDLQILDDPQGQILDTGGVIYLAKVDDEIVGTAGLVNEGDGVYELVKMSVTPAHQGKGISRLLIDQCIAKARELNAKKVILFSNSQLKTAIGLYERYGFKHLTGFEAPYESADVKMELVL